MVPLVGQAGPPPQARDPRVKMLCNLSRMKASEETCDSGLGLKSHILGFTFQIRRARKRGTWGGRWRIHVGVKMCTGNQISTFPDTWSSYSISLLFEDLCGNRCSSSGRAARQRRSIPSSLCNIWFTWTMISARQMTDPKFSDVTVSNEGREKSRKEHVPRIRWMSTIALLLS